MILTWFRRLCGLEKNGKKVQFLLSLFPHKQKQNNTKKEYEWHLQQVTLAFFVYCQAQVRHAESGVEQHQAYQDAVQGCRDWMSAARDRLAVCAEAGGDRQSLQNRLDRLQVGAELCVWPVCWQSGYDMGFGTEEL